MYSNIVEVQFFILDGSIFLLHMLCHRNVCFLNLVSICVHFSELKSKCFVVIMYLELESGCLVTDKEEKRKVWVCVCVWVRRNESEKERDREMEVALKGLRVGDKTKVYD